MGMVDWYCDAQEDVLPLRVTAQDLDSAQAY